MQHVAADLRAPADVLLLAPLGRQLLGPLSLLQLQQAGAKQAHGRRLVLRLGALVLALDDDPGRHVGDPHRRVGLVDVLPAGARGAVRVDAQVLLVEVHLHRVVDERPHVHLGEARVAAMGGVERRQAHQAVDAALGGEQAVGVLAAGDEGRRLEAGLVAGRGLLHLDLEAAPLGPAQVHAQEHLGPVLRVGAAGPGAHRDHRVAGVVAAVEQARLLERPQPLLERAEAGSRARRRARRRRPPARPAPRGRTGPTPASGTSAACAGPRRARPRSGPPARSRPRSPGRCISASSCSTSDASLAGSKVVREQGQALADLREPRGHALSGDGLGHHPELSGPRRAAAGAPPRPRRGPRSPRGGR